MRPTASQAPLFTQEGEEEPVQPTVMFTTPGPSSGPESRPPVVYGFEGEDSASVGLTPALDTQYFRT